MKPTTSHPRRPSTSTHEWTSTRRSDVLLVVHGVTLILNRRIQTYLIGGKKAILDADARSAVATCRPVALQRVLRYC